MKRVIRTGVALGLAVGAAWVGGCSHSEQGRAATDYPYTMTAGDTIGMAVFSPRAQASAEPRAGRMPSAEATLR
ncbi:MAG: hypothetical protein ACKVW3_07625 [Phycisphaerales bacterium]